MESNIQFSFRTTGHIVMIHLEIHTTKTTRMNICNLILKEKSASIPNPESLKGLLLLHKQVTLIYYIMSIVNLGLSKTFHLLLYPQCVKM